MGIFGSNENFNFIFTPAVGKKIRVTIVSEVKRITNTNGNQEFNYKGKNKTVKDFYDVIDVVDENGEEKQLLINIWLVYFKLKEMEDLDIGDEIEIEHISSKEYKITKV